MRYFIFFDTCGLLSLLPVLTANGKEAYYFHAREGLGSCDFIPDGIEVQSIGDFKILNAFKITSQDKVILHFLDADLREKTHSMIRSISSNVPIMLIPSPCEENVKKKQYIKEDPCISVIPIEQSIRTKVQEKWHQIEIKRKLEKLKAVVNPDKPLLILTQNDPDPDAIASAMALQYILKRNDETAPIVTFKAVSRNENINMINMIEATVTEITKEDIDLADQIAIVDAQPGFFKREFPNLKIVVDHHPVTEEYKVPFKDLQVTYGATSTIFTEYILATESTIIPKLATALYYGIKTDTLMLGREVSKADFNAFTHLWHSADHHQIGKMEKPRLKAEEIDVYIRALKKHELQSGFLFVSLSDVPKDDIIPRLADFVLQIGKTDFAVVWGIVGDVSILSARSQVLNIHAGEIMKQAFGEIGSAGGHQSMARAMIPTSILLKEFKVRSIKRLSDTLRKRLLTLITKQKKTGRD